MTLRDGKAGAHHGTGPIPKTEFGHHDQGNSLPNKRGKDKNVSERQKLREARARIPHNSDLNPEQLTARAERWRRLYEACQNPTYRDALPIDELAEFHACCDDMGAERHCGMGLWERLTPPIQHKANGKAKQVAPTLGQPIERQAKAERPKRAECPREILFLRQLERATPRLSLAARVLGIYIGQLSGTKGYAHFAHATVADAMGVSVPTIKRAIRELVEGGHVTVRAGRGRGNVSEITPILKEPYLTGILPQRADDDDCTK